MAMISRARRMLEGLRSAAKSERVAMASGTPARRTRRGPGPPQAGAKPGTAPLPVEARAPDAPRREDAASRAERRGGCRGGGGECISRSERNRRRGSVTPVFHQAADRDAREILGSLGARGGTRVGRRGRDGEVSALSVTSARVAWTVAIARSGGRVRDHAPPRRSSARAREGNVPVSSRCRAELAGTRSAPLTRSPRGSDSNSMGINLNRDFGFIQAVSGVDLRSR